MRLSEGIAVTFSVQCLALVFSQSTDNISAVTSPVKPSLDIQALVRDTHEITINWTLTDPDNLVENRWRITVEDLKLTEYIASYEGEHNIDILHKTALVYVHSSDTKYNICLSTYLNKTAAVIVGYELIQACEEIKTIPTLLTSSLIPLIAVLLFFILLVLAGGITYKVKQALLAGHQYEKALADAETGEHRNGSVKFQTNSKICNHIEA